jgi:23S rRNA (adenine2503-C2)-methyltransferase
MQSDTLIQATAEPSGPAARPALVGFDPAAIAARVAELPGGDRRYRGEQIFRWLHARHAASFAAMSDLPAVLRDALAARFRPGELELVQAVDSQESSTTKLVLRTRDGAEIETVRITTPKRVTLCLSSQVGCGFGCVFCRTAQMGRGRDLDPGEIVDQVLHVHRLRPLPDRYNIVFMGMGEPLANFERVVRATELFGRQDGLAIGPRRITLSTVGLVPEIERLARERPRLRLAVSLTATTDTLRARLMPIARRYPLAELLRAVGAHVRSTGQRVTFEYVLLAGVNDTLADAKRLARISGQVPCKINLIPWNGNPADGFRAPSRNTIDRFAEYLYPRTYAVMVRATQGRDILAACGQLARGPLPRRQALREAGGER